MLKLSLYFLHYQIISVVLLRINLKITFAFGFVHCFFIFNVGLGVVGIILIFPQIFFVLIIIRGGLVVIVIGVFVRVLFI